MLEHEIKDELFRCLDSSLEKVRVMEELVIAKSRADMVAVLPDKLIGFELKSDSDTYTRLRTQIKDYDRFFDYNCLVVGASHRRHAAEHVPEHWGVICISDGSAEILKVPSPNPKNERLKLRWQLSLLWRSELAHISKANGLHKYSNKKKLHIIYYMLDSVDHDILRRALCDELFEREYDL